MASSLLSCTSSKDQLKQQGTKEGLLSFCRPGTIKSKAVLFKSKTTEHVQSVIKAKEMTFNFYVKAKNLQIQGKENANQLRVELVNLARSKKPKWQRRTRYEEQNEQDGVEASRSSDDEGDEENNALTYNHLYCLP